MWKIYDKHMLFENLFAKTKDLTKNYLFRKMD